MRESTKSCVAYATNILGDKWTPLLISALSEGKLRFCELQEKAGGLNPRTLSQRLDTMESKNIIAKHYSSEAPSRYYYELTAKGTDLIPVLQSMAKWGAKYPSPK